MKQTIATVNVDAGEHACLPAIKIFEDTCIPSQVCDFVERFDLPAEVFQLILSRIEEELSQNNIKNSSFPSNVSKSSLSRELSLTRRFVKNHKFSQTNMSFANASKTLRHSSPYTMLLENKESAELILGKRVREKTKMLLDCEGGDKEIKKIPKLRERGFLNKENTKNANRFEQKSQQLKNCENRQFFKFTANINKSKNQRRKNEKEMPLGSSKTSSSLLKLMKQFHNYPFHKEKPEKKLNRTLDVNQKPLSIDALSPILHRNESDRIY